ncbi:hypothetical protein AMK68_04305 [candidate division KD3-62 bacterium DG_56]|uniref:BFN domain-containing protein n=1 Tax=candidate division KD3-62 bacterium DG_56 TaxID=1704032 RepID=A0A0S7XKJ8_9BACT|nr:MAG: hypothetical protein AMK68_04305 [candidate division KD3-62 bacterium DG_56]
MPVQVWRLGRDEEDEDVILLRDNAGRVLPVWIAPCEAAAIWLRLEHEQVRSVVRRPMTHDLLLAIIERLGMAVERIVIDDLANGTYYATLHLQRNGEPFTIDARPSDAIALSLRAEVPVLVAEEIMRQAGEVVDEGQQIEPEEGPGDVDPD